ncbi:MAG: carbohydrate kinase [Methylovulum sp.]|uniref:carbohydrate kinase family protein n=1 Tax=Methylovulum sp. TaxID=1916980 RepID=UPI002637BFF0|nr:carbohydrate kinase [Methylovulum sp.]MDD2723385.1 carbohydrate kinase [Methylovulum sp.]MDD5126397.1 carbohydrate kinase [Methylovulum sp.]
MKQDPITLFGEVLFDQFPDGQAVLGGAPFNVAWHLQAFGQRPCFISRVGADALGGQIRADMLAWGMDTTQLQTDETHPTGVVQITINAGEPAYEILDQQAYDYLAAPSQPIQSSLIYHGTLALRHPTSAQTLAKMLAQHDGMVFLDVNLRAPWWCVGQVAECLKAADWVKLNDDELRQLAKPKATLKETLQVFLDAYQLTGLIVTRGELGAVALTENGGYLEVTPNALAEVIDTVGAGDAFASVLLLGLQHQWPLALTLRRAQDFASALVTQKGATVQDMGFYVPFIVQWQL